MTVQEIITSIKPQLYPYVGRVRLTNAILLNHINAVDQEIFGLLHQVAPNLITSVSSEITIITDATISGNEHYYSLSAVLSESWDVDTFLYKRALNDKTYTVEIRPQSEIDDPSTDGPQAWIRQDDGTLYLHPIDPWGDNWDTARGAIADRNWWNTANDSLYVYGTQKGSVTALTSDLNSPDICLPYIEAAVITRTLLQDNGVPESVLQRAVNSMQKAEAAMIINLHNLGGVESTLGSRNSNSEDSYGAFHARLF